MPEEAASLPGGETRQAPWLSRMLDSPTKIIAFQAVAFLIFMWIIVARTEPNAGWLVFTTIFSLVCFGGGAYRTIRKLGKPTTFSPGS